MLGGGPQHVQQMARVDWCHFAFVYPALDHLHPPFGPLGQRRFQVILDHRRAVHDFGRPDLGPGLMPAADLHLCVDIGANPLGRTIGLVETVSGLQPDVENALHHPAIQGFLGREIIMQVRLGQPSHVGNQLHGGAAKACLGKYLFGRLQDCPLAGAADLFLAWGSCIAVHGVVSRFLLTAWSGCGVVFLTIRSGTGPTQDQVQEV